ncbi:MULTISPECIES: MFS transporter [unclassified Mycolicibacterium]|uniref:MFS transporter n=1 Tax=unclassified Mycolicibacterium TaxID=2636767 RepID=UPI002ED8732F
MGSSAARTPLESGSTHRVRGFKRVLAASMAGAVLEWYDFAVYGILAATVLGPLFFPGEDGVVKLLLALATQGLGFVARPLGGMVFGHLGDKFGRKPMLVTTFVMLGAATATIGVLPTYDQVGIWASVMLVGLRMIQGFALGGEFGAAVLLVSEYGDSKHRGFWASWPQAGAPTGTALAAAVVSAIAVLSPDGSFDDWGWRVAFLFAIPLLVIGFWIRSDVEESPLFKVAQAQSHSSPAKPRSSILEALAQPRAVCIGIGMRFGENVAFYFFTIFAIAYTTTYSSFTHEQVVAAVTCASLFQFIGMVGGGAWSDRVGRKPAMLLPAGLLVAWVPIFFWLVRLENLPMLWLAICVGALLHGMLAGPEAAWITELFPTSHRYAGASLVFQGSSILAGAPAPFIAVWLITRFGVGAVITYLVTTLCITIIALVCSRETRGVELDSVA